MVISCPGGCGGGCTRPCTCIFPPKGKTVLSQLICKRCGKLRIPKCDCKLSVVRK